MTDSLATDAGLVIFPPKHPRAAIDGWRRIYNPHHEVIPPHITVTYPPFVPEAE